MAFRFDAKSALARIENPASGAATPATPATVRETVAGVATVAGLTFATAQAPDLDAFEERAATAQHDGGLTRAQAEALAAQDQGCESAEALCAAAVLAWRAHLEALHRAERAPRGRDCIAQALRFIADGWAEKAAALGWPELELFGADPRAPWERLDRMGAAYSAFTPCAVTAETIVYPGSGARPMRRWRASQADGARLPWENVR